MSEERAVSGGKLGKVEGGGYGSRAYMAYVLFLLFMVYALYAMNRSVLLVLVEPIKRELGFSDSQMGFIIGPAFSIFFAIAGIPCGLLADRTNRRNMVALVVAGWSIATGLCGTVQSFMQMAIGRAAVGMGIAGGPPASQAMISDIFPAAWRATALSFFYIGGTIGAVTAFGAGAWAAARFGWRETLVLAAIPGLVVALLIYLTVREPVRGLSDGPGSATGSRSVGETFRFILGQRSAVQIILGLVLLHMVGNGLMAFLASFLMRTHGMTLKEAGGMISFLYFATSPVSQIVAGFLADYLGRYDVRWRLRLGPLGSVFCAFAMCTLTLVDSKTAAGTFFALWALGAALYQAPLYALLLSMVKPHMRATMSSIQFVLTAAIGGALGPLFVGAVSDWLSPVYGENSMRYALFIQGLFYLWAALHFILGERRLKENIARAEQD